MNICLFTAEEISKPLNFNDERAEHLLKIIHKKEGDYFAAGIIGGKSGTALITKITDKQIFFDFTPDGDGKPLTNLIMIIGFPRPIQLKRLLRDVAALGVKEVHLTGTDLGEKSYMQSTLVEKGNAYKMLLDGTVQAGGTFVPELFLHKTLNECLNYLKQNTDSKLLLALDNVNPSLNLSSAIKTAPVDKKFPVIAAIGSERGWTDKERKLLESEGYIRCSMGNRIMRTETAATVAGSIILNEYGYMD